MIASIRNVVGEMKKGKATDRIRIGWNFLKSSQLGRKFFSWIVGRMAPYSGSIRPEILALQSGHSKVFMRDRHQLRNHIKCIHAIALANLAEFTGNIALAYTIPADARFIVTKITMQYVKKARGNITATCTCNMPDTNRKEELCIKIELWDKEKNLVCIGNLYSLVGPVY